MWKLDLKNLTIFVTSLVLGAVVFSQMKMPIFAEWYLVGKTQSVRGFIGKLISVQPWRFQHGHSCCGLWGIQSGNRCMVISMVDACWTVCSWEQAALRKIQQKVHERLISKKCEMMPEINSYSAYVQLINHPNTLGICAKRGNQLLEWVLILKFQWQVLLNDPVRLIVSRILWVFTAWLTCICPNTEMSMLYTCTAVAQGNGCRYTNT